MEGTPRNLVVFCDGTGNQVEGDLSNVIKLYRATVRDDGQRAFYDPGVGTIGNDSAWGRLRQRAYGVFALVTGAGLDANILDAFRWLCATHRMGDRIFLFGFSRGAYTVRALAGLIHMVGLLEPDQAGLADYALNAYKHSAERSDLAIAWGFARIVGARRATIHFMGLWDTVASMIVPRPDRFYVPSLRMLPYTRENPSVRAVRHAVAIDERRRMFRLNRWVQRQLYVEDPFAEPRPVVDQDVRQMWFAGVHADIGGGYPEAASALAKFPLAWMADEAAAHGLRIDRRLVREMVEGGGRFVAADAAGPLHRSLSGPWWALEVMPKRARWRETRRAAALGLYLPLGERRRFGDGAEVAPSVDERRRLVPGYDPAGVPGPSAGQSE